MIAQQVYLNGQLATHSHAAWVVALVLAVLAIAVLVFRLRQAKAKLNETLALLHGTPPHEEVMSE